MPWSRSFRASSRCTSAWATLWSTAAALRLGPREAPVRLGDRVAQIEPGLLLVTPAGVPRRLGLPDGAAMRCPVNSGCWREIRTLVLLTSGAGRVMADGRGGGAFRAMVPAATSESREYPPCRETDGTYCPCISLIGASAAGSPAPSSADPRHARVPTGCTPPGPPPVPRPRPRRRRGPRPGRVQARQRC